MCGLWCQMAAVERTGLLKAFKLQTSISTVSLQHYTSLTLSRSGLLSLTLLASLCPVCHSQLNMHLFDVNGHIQKYPSALSILQTYFPVRLSYYTKRRTALLAQLSQQLQRLTHKTRFIQLVTFKQVSILNTKRAQLVQALAQHGLVDGVEALLDMRVSAFSEEEVDRLEGERRRCEEEVRRLESLTAERMWEADLDRLEGRMAKLLDSTDEQIADTSSSSIKKTHISDLRVKRAVEKRTGQVRSGSKTVSDRVRAREPAKQQTQ